MQNGLVSQAQRALKSGSVLMLGAIVLFAPASLFALPFNRDLVDVQIKTGAVMRPKDAESVPMGSLEHRVDTKEVALAMKNPFAGDKHSVVRGKRLFRVNCYPCHGDISKKPYVIGPVAQKAPMMAAAPNLSDPAIRNKPDGHFYGFIHLGGMAIMPRYGWKLSPHEHWDIVSYIKAQKNG